VIFYHNAEQKKLAEKKIADLTKSKKYSDPIVTQLVAASTFWKAEEYHQQYLRKRNLGAC
jgi:peptide-methionine (S)-S-oxide reductase